MTIKNIQKITFDDIEFLLKVSEMHLIDFALE